MRSLWTRWKSDRRGSMAVHVAVMAPVMLGVTALAVDYGRVVSKEAQIQSALDSATLAATQALSYDAKIAQSELEKVVKSFFDANAASVAEAVTCQPIVVKVDRPEIRVDTTIDCMMKTQFGAILSPDGFDFKVDATTDFDFGEADIAFMLDVSGSMGGSAKIGALKTAMKDAIDTLMAISQNGSVRIAIAPYSTSVNAGSYAKAATGGLPDDGDTCVTERKGAHAFDDASPTVASLNDKAGWCPQATIVPLTDKTTVLKSSIDGLKTGGMTAGHLGISWAWYLISSKWAGFWPSASKPKSNGATTRKAVVLMTDGQFNTYYENGLGNSGAQAKKICKDMRDDGVIVYAVAFKAPKNAQALLQNCSSGGGYYFEPSDAAGLKDAYKQIANSFRRHILTN